jgi:uncharacterized protein (TIGR00730 family)
MIKTISVFGTGRAKAGDKNYVLAEQLGRALAGAGYTIANGGYGGTMEASAKGAGAAGGEVVGVTCLAFKKGRANQFISCEISTNSLNERLQKLIEIGNAYVVLPGGTGTLLELAFIWELKNKGFLSEDKPIILLGNYWAGLAELVSADDADSPRHLMFAGGPQDVVEILKGRG